MTAPQPPPPDAEFHARDHRARRAMSKPEPPPPDVVLRAAAALGKLVAAEFPERYTLTEIACMFGTGWPVSLTKEDVAAVRDVERYWSPPAAEGEHSFDSGMTCSRCGVPFAMAAGPCTGSPAKDEDGCGDHDPVPDKDDDFLANRHADLDAGELGGMADADYYDRVNASPPPDGCGDHDPVPGEMP